MPTGLESPIGKGGKLIITQIQKRKGFLTDVEEGLRAREGAGSRVCQVIVKQSVAYLTVLTKVVEQARN